jgi:NAD(P)H dehydrogenase (quinone)
MALLVTAAADGVGRRVAEVLVDLGAELHLVATDPALIPHLPGTSRFGSDRAALDAACRDATAALLLPPLGWPTVADEDEAPLREALAAAAVPHLVVVSLQGAAADARHPLTRAHAEREDAWSEVPATVTVLRPSLPMALVPRLFGPDGVIRGPGGDGAVAFVAHDDVARVAAALLRAEPGEERLLEVTGGEALTLEALAARVAALTGLDLAYVDEPAERTRARWSETGAAEGDVEILVGTYLGIADGAFGTVRDTVERIGGRTPTLLESYLEARRELLSDLRPDAAG